jgi:hypothetical protein
LGFDFDGALRSSPLGVSAEYFCEVWDVSRVGLGFLSNPKFRVFLEKVSLFSLFLGFDFDGCSVVSPLGVLCRIFLSEEVWGRESSRLEFSSNPKFRVLLRKVRCAPLSILFFFFGVLD